MTSEHVAFGSDLQFWCLCLLLDADVNQTFYAFNLSFDVVGCHKQLCQVGTENLYRDGSSCTCEHVVDAVTERLPYSRGDARNGSHLLTDISKELFLRAVSQFKVDIYLGAVCRLRVFVQLATSCTSRSGSDFRN